MTIKRKFTNQNKSRRTLRKRTKQQRGGVQNFGMSAITQPGLPWVKPSIEIKDSYDAGLMNEGKELYNFKINLNPRAKITITILENNIRHPEYVSGDTTKVDFNRENKLLKMKETKTLNIGELTTEFDIENDPNGDVNEMDNKLGNAKYTYTYTNVSDKQIDIHSKIIPEGNEVLLDIDPSDTEKIQNYIYIYHKPHGSKVDIKDYRGYIIINDKKVNLFNILKNGGIKISVDPPANVDIDKFQY